MLFQVIDTPKFIKQSLWLVKSIHLRMHEDKDYYSSLVQILPQNRQKKKEIRIACEFMQFIFIEMIVISK